MFSKGSQHFRNCAYLCKHSIHDNGRCSGVANPKCLIFGEQQYFLWDTTSQSTKLLDILNILGAMAPWLCLWADAKQIQLFCHPIN